MIFFNDNVVSSDKNPTVIICNNRSRQKELMLWRVSNFSDSLKRGNIIKSNGRTFIYILEYGAVEKLRGVRPFEVHYETDAINVNNELFHEIILRLQKS